MAHTQAVKDILANYDADSPGTRANLARMLNHGTLAGTGKMVILPVDQGFEHGPARSFGCNPDAYDPDYFLRLAIESGCNAYAAPLGSLEISAGKFAGEIPLILKINSSNSLSRSDGDPTQAVTSSIDDALRLGCSAIGYTIYPGSDNAMNMMETFSALTEEAKANGLAVVVWCYARGGNLSSAGETAQDIIAYAAHMGCLLGAHIVKVKLPSDHLELPEAKKAYEENNIPIGTQAERVRDVVNSCFAGKRMVVFSGGGKKGEEGVLDDARAIRDGGGNGSIIGRNAFQRPYKEGLKLLRDIMDVYKG